MYRKILVTSDGSAMCEEAFPHVAQLAADNAEVVLFTVTGDQASAAGSPAASRCAAAVTAGSAMLCVTGHGRTW